MNEQGPGVTLPVDIEHIQRLLPHRYPFLLVDRVLEFTAGETIVAIKNVTSNEPFFQGHFPGHPVMPGVLIVEALAQASGLLIQLTAAAGSCLENPLFYLVKVDKARFNAPVVPGDQLRMELEMLQVRGMMCRMQGVAKVDGDVVCEAEMSAMVRDR